MTNLTNITSSAENPANQTAAADANTQIFIDANIAVLSEGLALLRELNDENYVADCRPAFRATVGAHFRHLLEHYQCFLQCVETGSVCYDSRARDADLECNRDYAVEVMESLVSLLGDLSDVTASVEFPGELLSVNDQQSPSAVSTTLQRELLFLQSHSVHHYAMIAAMCRIQGVKVAENFGVAIATQVFESEKRCSDSTQGHIDSEGEG